MQKLICSSFIFFLLNTVSGQTLDGFKIIKQVPSTIIKDQGQSGTCWSFGTLSFLESEAIRLGKGKHDISEMYIVRNIYPEKVKNYIRTQGHTYFTFGSQCHDVFFVMKNYGLVPESAYLQKRGMQGDYNTAILDSSAAIFVRKLKSSEEQEVPVNWAKDFDKILNNSLGVPPLSFKYNNQNYTPKSFCSTVLGLNPDDYIQITSYTHHPFYTSFCIESKYNWSFGLYYNLPLEKFMRSIDNSLENGYSVVFNGDVSEASFDYYNGVAKIDDEPSTQQHRQLLFENGNTTIDHIMHIVGIALGSDGKKYYLTKNSWGQSNNCGGYIYISEDYIKLKAVSVVVHKNMLCK